MQRKRVILLEFNELCPSLLTQWMDDGTLPTFRRFYRDSNAFTAVADDLDHDNLEPWIQWYSIHTGLPFRQHGVHHLTDGPAAEHEDIWRTLLKHGLRVGNCASMNAKRFHAADSFYLPDPWCTSETPSPSELLAYQTVVTNFVQENSTASRGRLTGADYLRFASFMASHGLSLPTLLSLGKQAWSETIFPRGTAWQRAPILDLLQFDIFRSYWNRVRPAFSTFFINSTAHYQHAYWHCAFPEHFPTYAADPRQTTKFRDAVLFGYRRMDALLHRFMALEREGALLILATALSQQANSRVGRTYYRPVNVHQLLSHLGIKPTAVMPVMSEQFSIRFSTNIEADVARSRLAALEVDGESLIGFAPAPDRTVFFGAMSQSALPPNATLQGLPNGPEPFHEVFAPLPHLKSGIHHPESVLWFKLGDHRVHRQKVSILDIFPTILEYFDIERQSVDPEGRLQGTSLLPLMQRLSKEVVRSADGG